MSLALDILDIIKNLSNFYEKNELAYLAATSKIENPIRDKIAYRLQVRYQDRKIICREWTGNKKVKSKADLAILSAEGDLEALVEFKAHSSMKGIVQWAKEMVKDYNKCNLWKDSNPEILLILFANIHKKLPKRPGMEQSIKYYENVENALWNKWDGERMHKSLIEKFTSLVSHNKLEVVDIEAGDYMGESVELKAFVFTDIVI